MKRSAGWRMIASFFSRSGHVATIALEDRRTINTEWCAAMFWPAVKKPEKAVSEKHRNLTSKQRVITNRVSDDRASCHFKSRIHEPPSSPQPRPTTVRLLRYPHHEESNAYRRFFDTSKETIERPLESSQDGYHRVRKSAGCNEEYLKK